LQAYVDSLTVGYNGQIYPTSNPTIIVASAIDIACIDAFTEVATKTGSDEVTYIQELNSVDEYHNGVTWVESNGTYAQSNIATDVNTHGGELELGTGYRYRLVAILHSADGQTTPELESATVTYCFAAPLLNPINECVVWCALADIVQGDLSKYTELKFHIANDDFMHSLRIMPAEINSVSFLSDYTTSLSVVETETVNVNMDFYITGLLDGQPFEILFNAAPVPNVPIACITAITSVLLPSL